MKLSDKLSDVVGDVFYDDAKFPSENERLEQVLYLTLNCLHNFYEMRQITSEQYLHEVRTVIRRARL